MKKIFERIKLYLPKDFDKKIDVIKGKSVLLAHDFIKYSKEYFNRIKLILIKNFEYYFPKTKKYIDDKCLEVSELFDEYLRLENDQIGLGPVKWGIRIITIFSLIFFVWAGLMPINSSSIAQGVVVLDFNKKTIQHLEGGIIQEILVKEGQEVVTGSDLVILQSVQAKSQQSAVQKQLLTSRAIYKRLTKEQSYDADLSLSTIKEQGGKLGYQEIDELVKTQYHIYNIKKEAYFGKINILKKRVNQIEKEIEALEYQTIATGSQLRILRKELKMVKKMVELRNYPITDQLNIEKQIAELQGKRGSLTASIAKSQQSISETNLEIVNFTKEHLNTVLAEMQEVEAKISGLTEQLSSTSDVLKRTIITAPASGIVMDLKFHTKGAVIPPGGEIMSVVPQDEELIVEAKIDPKDIDMVKRGLKAKINLSAFKAKKVPKLDGELMSVSADILVDEMTGESYFLGRIRISEKSLNSLKNNIQLYPGMPAEVFIITGSRTLLQYLISPIKDATYRAFRDD